MTSFAERVKETSTTTGTGNFTLAGAVTGFQTFNAAFGTNIPFEYCIEAVDGSGVPSGQWEVGDGYLSASTTLVRSIPREGSSGAGTAVNFSSGTKNVFCTFPAHRARESTRAFDMIFGLP